MANALELGKWHVGPPPSRVLQSCGSTLFEQALAFAHDHRVDKEPVAVYKIVLHQRLHERGATVPYRPTIIVGVLTAVVAGLFNIESVAELVNIGGLSSFKVVCAAV